MDHGPGTPRRDGTGPLSAPGADRYPALLDRARLDWNDDGPRSSTVGDVFFSREDGVAEADGVFCEGNDLPRRFAAGGPDLCIAETGFGSGLNLLVAARCFRRHAPRAARLHFVSFEHAPFALADRRRLPALLARRGEHELAADAARLVEAFPPPVRGWHRLAFDDPRITVSLWLGDALTGLEDWAAQQREHGLAGADAWFLDGFAPSRDPGLWSPACAHLLARCSSPGASLATFSVARAVRDALGAAGFEVEKRPGLLGKRERLVGRLDTARDAAPAQRGPQAVHVVGAGLAGACVARACAERGLDVTVHDPHGAAARASGNRHAVLHPRLTLETDARPRWLLAAYGHARRFWRAPALADCVRPQPVLQLAPAREPERMARLAGHYALVSDALDGAVEAVEQGLCFPHGAVVDLPAAVSGLLTHDRIVLRADAAPSGTASGKTIIVAAGTATAALAGLRLGRQRGQLSAFTPAPPDPGFVVTGRGHALCRGDEIVVGASYERSGDETTPSDREREENHERLLGLAPLLELRPGDAVRPSWDWVGVRVNAPDRLPAVGDLDDGRLVSTAHASSGLLSCPLAAEFLAARLAGEPPVLDRELQERLSPRRLRDG